MITLPPKPELLCPGGTLEKLKLAIHYGADACYIAGMNYGLRTRAGNFTPAEMREAVDFAHSHSAKVYVVANMVAHEGEEAGVGAYFQSLEDLGVDAVLISDPGFIEICRQVAPGLPIHLSTQASAVNYAALNFWADQGLDRVVLGREVSLAEIRTMRAHSDIELECFLHGAMCVGYSGRCVLSNHICQRDANRGGCAQPCRWFYDLWTPAEGAGDSPWQKLGQRGQGQDTGTAFSMSAADLSMIDHLPDLIQAGVQSLKVEGRMKSIHYVSTVANVYRTALDSYYADPDHYEVQAAWREELQKVAQRELSTGFFYGQPGASAQFAQQGQVDPGVTFVGRVLAYDPQKSIATLEQRNKFAVGDILEFYGPSMRTFRQRVTWLENGEGERITACPHPLMTLRLPVDQPVQAQDLVRLVHTRPEV